MKKLLLASLMLLGTSNVFAQSLSCNLGVLLADKGGYLMPSEETLSITANVMSSHKTLKDCQKLNRGDLQISLCASEAKFVGGIEATLVIEGNNDENFPTIGKTILGTLKNGKGLMEISTVKPVLHTFNNKLEKAGITAEEFFEGDSIRLDNAVEEGLKKNVLTPNEPVIIYIDSCSIN